jgi:hypothetical protein
MEISNGKFKMSDSAYFEKALSDNKKNKEVKLSSSILEVLHKELGDFEISL